MLVKLSGQEGANSGFGVTSSLFAYIPCSVVISGYTYLTTKIGTYFL